MRAASSRSPFFEQDGLLEKNATRHFRESRAPETEIPATECRCGRCRSCFRHTRARSLRFSTTRSEQTRVSLHRAFPASLPDKRAFQYRPGHRRRETKRRSVSTTFESAEEGGPQCGRRKCEEAARGCDSKCL